MERDTFVQGPLTIALLLRWYCLEAGRKQMRACRKSKVEVGDSFRVDAKAEGDKLVIGGWESKNGQRTKEARWFTLELYRKTAAWAYFKGDPFRVIATLELIGVLVAVCVFLRDGGWKDRIGRTGVTGLTDNKGNMHLVT